MGKRRGNQRYSLEQVNSALEMIRKGENPFRVAKRTGISRSNLLYHMEKLPDNAFPTGVNPVLDHIRRQIEILLWKTRLRLIKNIFHKSAKSDERTSAILWKAINESPIPSVGTLKSLRPILGGFPADDKVTFREFVFERKDGNGSKEGSPKNDLAGASLDNAIDGESVEED